jgi:hypothetical protein
MEMGSKQEYERESEKDEVTESYNNKSSGSACAWKELKGRWGGGKKGSWSWLLCAATDTTPKQKERDEEEEEEEEEGSFPPALGFSSFLWGYMG